MISFLRIGTIPVGARLVSALFALAVANAAPADRIKRPIDSSHVKAVSGTTHHSAVAQYDRGVAADAMPMDYVVLTFPPSAAQQASLAALIAEQQNPASPNYRKWLTPEEFGNRFGLSAPDRAKISQWMASQGFIVQATGRGGNWMAFSGTAGQISRSLRTSIHRFQVDGETHYANTVEPSLPDAIADVAGGFIGLNDFPMKPFSKLASPLFTSSGSYYLVPEDFSTIYNIAPLYRDGFDGTGQSIAVVGQTNIVLSDLRAFKTRFNLPANDPKVIFYGGTNPGVNGDLIEAALDLEWAGAIAPKASLYYVYGRNAFTAMVTAVGQNLANVISISYGGCESDFSGPFFRSVAQQANAQGISILVSSGDTGAASCDFAGSEPQVTHGNQVSFPAVLPEVTAVGGTQFVEGADTYWRPTNSANGGSALSYIPEEAWNQSNDRFPGSGGGGASLVYPKPAWQQAPGVPAGNVRYVPDVALSASSAHDPYLVYSGGGLVLVGGTSAPTPALAGVVALLNQYLVKNGTLKQPGLGNINPQLYRLFQAAPAAFHDVTTGTNFVPCLQGSVDCVTGFVGYAAASGYDLATGLGSLDVANLANSWNTAGENVTASLTLSSAQVTLNESVTATLTVSAANSAPLGPVDFSIAGAAFGSVPLTPSSATTSTATLSLPVGALEIGSFTVTAQYSGSGVFNGAGDTATVQVVVPPNASAVVLDYPDQVFPATPTDAQGSVYQATFTLREVGGVPAMVTGFSIDGQPQVLSQYFAATAIPANGRLTVTVTLRNISAPATRTFVFTGVDVGGVAWTRQATVTYSATPLFDDFTLTAFPSTISQNSANPACQWPVRLSIDDLGGFTSTVDRLFAGGVDYSSRITQIFGTPRLRELGSLQGTLCLNDVFVGGAVVIRVGLGNQSIHETAVILAGPAGTSATLAVAPATVLLSAPTGQTAVASVAVNVPPTQSWTALVTPLNRTTGWLTTSRLFGTGSGQIVLTASGAGFAPGVYRAGLNIQSPGATPQAIVVPIEFVNNGSASGTVITGVGNAALPSRPVLSPGALITIVGNRLSNTTRAITAAPLPFSADGVSVQVNGIQAAVLYISPDQLNIQVPYGAGAGAGVIGVNNNGQVAGLPVQIAPAAPAIFTDAGAVLPAQSVNPGGFITLYLTGAGEVSTLIATGAAPSTRTTAANLPKPVLPLQATVGGVPVFVQFAGLGAGLVGVMQVNLIVPESVPLGLQDIVITVNGVASNPAKIMVLPPKVS